MYRSYPTPNYAIPFSPNKYRPPIPSVPPPKIEKKPEKKKFKFDVEYFEILGFKLYYDDLIIIGLIILLFEEGEMDYLLLIALIMLIGD